MLVDPGGELITILTNRNLALGKNPNVFRHQRQNYTGILFVVSALFHDPDEWERGRLFEGRR